MKQIVLNVKDSSKLAYLIQLIKQLDFVEVETLKKKKNDVKYDFFSSAGLWAIREISAKELRKKAWTRQE